MKNAKYFYLIINFVSLVLLSISTQAFETKADQAIIVDYDTGVVLLDKNADEQMTPSSMTKLMTVYIIFDHLKNGLLNLDDKFTVSKKAWRKGGSKMFLKHTQKVTIDELLNGIIVQSGNDACIVIAEGIASSEENFAELMNETAEKIGLKNSNFKNSTGWPDEDHYMTARDLSILSKRLIADFPEYYKYFAHREYTFNGIKQSNRNSLLFGDLGVDGLKTGHTEAGGYGIAVSAVSEDKRRVITIVNGLNSDYARADEAQRLINHGFRYFVNHKFFTKGDIVGEAKIWQGKQDMVALKTNQDIILPAPKLNMKDTTFEIHYKTPLAAPIQRGDEIAQLVLKIPEVGDFTYQLYSNEDIKRIGLISRMFSNLKFHIKKLIN